MRLHLYMDGLRLLIFLALTKTVWVTPTADELVVFDRAQIAVELRRLFVARDLAISFSIEHDVHLLELAQTLLVGLEVLHGMIGVITVGLTWGHLECASFILVADRCCN